MIILQFMETNKMSKIIKILAVEDDDVDYITMTRAIQKCSFEANIERVSRIEDAEDKISKNKYDCILLDFRLPDGTGLDFLITLNQAHKTKETAIIMLTAETDISIAIKAMKNGAKDYIPKAQICSETLEISITKALDSIELEQQVIKYQSQIEQLAFHDTLTKLPNRYVFDDRLQQLILLSQRTNQTFMVGILDLNKFKAINDELGHHAGDKVLQTIASRLSKIIRQSDTIARYGGDEFVLLLPETNKISNFEEFSQRMIDVTSKPMPDVGKDISIGISIGLSQFPIHGTTSDELLKAADKALYQVKNNEIDKWWNISNAEKKE